MTNNFFNQFNDLMLITESVNLTIRKNSEDELTVCVTPIKKVEDKAKDLLQPILFTGKVEEFDAQFFELLKTPLENSNNLLRNIDQHEKSVELAAENSAIAKAEKEKQKKVREKSIKELEKAVKYWDEKQYDKCKFICNQILNDDPKFSKASQLVKECDLENVQADIFSQASIEAPKEPVVEETQPLPDVPVAEPFESIVTPVSESTYPDGTPKIQNDKTPPIQENNSINTQSFGLSQEQIDILREENDLKYMSSQENKPLNHPY